MVITACKFNNFRQVKKLLNKYNVNTVDRYQSLLMIACKYGYYKIVKLLLEYGAYIEFKNKYEETALIYACKRGHYKIVKLLVYYGANINHRNFYGLCSYHFACGFNHFKIVRYLIKNIDNIYCNEDDNQTLLFMTHNKKMLTYLINKGININHIDKNNYTILDYELNRDYINYSFIKFLLKNNAKSYTFSNKIKHNYQDNYDKNIMNIKLIKILIEFDIYKEFKIIPPPYLIQNRYNNITKYMTFKENHLKKMIIHYIN